MQPTSPGGGSPLRPLPVTSSSTPTASTTASSLPASTIDSAGGLLHRARRAWMQRQLTRTVDEIRDLSARVPSARCLADLDDVRHTDRAAQSSRRLLDRLQGLRLMLGAETPDAKSARAVAVPLLLAQHKALSRCAPTYASAVLHEVPDEPANLFDSLARRTLAALEVRANPRNLAHLLSQLSPQALADRGDAALAALEQLLPELVRALALPSLSEAHARQLLEFVMPSKLQAVPADWLARAVHGLHAGYQQHRAGWPPQAPLHARMVEAVRAMSAAQLQALGRHGPPLALVFTPVLQQALSPAGFGAYAAGVAQRVNLLAKQASAGTEGAGGQAADHDFIACYRRMRDLRELALRAQDTDPATRCAIAGGIARELGTQRAQALWDQSVSERQGLEDAQADPGAALTATHFTTRREGKGDQADGDSGDEAQGPRPDAPAS